MDASDKGKQKRSLTPCASSSYESDPCYSSSSDNKKKFKRPFKKHEKGKYADEKGKYWKGASVSNWDIHDLQKLGINYESKAVSLSEMMGTVKSRTKSLTCKPFPSFINSLEEYTKQALNFSFPENLDRCILSNPDTTWTDIFNQFYSWIDGVRALIKKVRKEEYELIERDEVIRDLFEMWSVRIKDFMKYYNKFLSDQKKSLPKTESRFVQLFMTFSRIFFLDPEPGSHECKTIKLGREEHSCVPNIRFHLNDNRASKREMLMIMLTEVKKFGIKKESSRDSGDEEIFDIRSKLPPGILGQHGGELLVEKDNSALFPGVLGTICMGTEVIFTFMDMFSDHLTSIKENGETTEHSCMISYTKAYNYLLEKDRNELLPILFWLGYVQSLQ